MDASATAERDMSRIMSCGAAALYASGGFPGDPDTLRAISEREAAFGAPDFLGELFPAAAYRRPPPETLGVENADFRTLVASLQAAINENHGVSPPSGLVRLDDAVLTNNVLFAGPAGARRLVFETARPDDRVVVREPDAARIRPFGNASGPALFIGSVGSFNYGHWLIDDLPRLGAVALLQARYPRDTVTIVLTRYGGRLDAIRRESIRLSLGGRIPVRVAFVGRDEAVGFPRLYYPTPVSRHPLTKSPEAVGAMVRSLREGSMAHRRRLAYGRGLLRRPAAPLGLFVDRRSNRSRRLINKGEILAGVKARGFAVIDPESMSVARQVSYFTNARVVVGILGAAMTNTVFCRPGTPLVYLAPEGWFDPFFWDLAAIRRHRYHALFGQPAAEDEAHPYERAFTLSWASLEATLDRASRG